MSEHPPPRWLWLALLLVLLLPALPAKQEQSNRRDAIPDLTAARASLVRARIEGCCCDLPHSAALPAPQDPGYDVVVATAQEPENPRARSSAAPAALGPRGPPRS